jgi:hypothetical protein
MTEPEGLGELGRVEPPAPGVLDAAREVLWSAVAAEMLATAPPGAAQSGGASTDAASTDAASTDAASTDAASTDAARAGGEPAPGRNAGEAARQPRRPDPGPP